MLTNGSLKQWYAIYTRSRAEKKVLLELTKKSIETYLPLQKQLKQWSDRKKLVEEPLISGYIFVKVYNRDFIKVLNTSGVVKFVSFSGRPAFVRESEIEVIKKLLSSETNLTLVQENLLGGDLIEITQGTLAGIQGELVDYKGKKNVVVKIGEIGYSLMLTVPLDYLKLSSRRIAMAG